MQTKEEVLEYLKDQIKKASDFVIIEEYKLARMSKSTNLMVHKNKQDEIVELLDLILKNTDLIEQYEGNPFKDEINKQYDSETEKMVALVQIQQAEEFLNRYGKEVIKNAKTRNKEYNLKINDLEDSIIHVKKELARNKLIEQTIIEEFEIDFENQKVELRKDKIIIKFKKDGDIQEFPCNTKEISKVILDTLSKKKCIYDIQKEVTRRIRGESPVSDWICEKNHLYKNCNRSCNDLIIDLESPVEWTKYSKSIQDGTLNTTDLWNKQKNCKHSEKVEIFTASGMYDGEDDGEDEDDNLIGLILWDYCKECFGMISRTIEFEVE